MGPCWGQEGGWRFPLLERGLTLVLERATIQSSVPQNSLTACGDGKRAQEMKEKEGPLRASRPWLQPR